ncbi:unnamed protein product [marine sediment metagenome]|uniref:Uncharacterized protein n=1 Tax=marine sediment metagenome TaxID=412755 RepID=X1J3P3_9ZZZZ
MKKKILWKKAYTDKDGFTHIPIKNKGRKKFRCDECGEKVREIFTINPNELLIKRELCRECYCKTFESLSDLLKMFAERIECNNEAWCKAYQPISEVNETCNVILKCSEFKFKNNEAVNWNAIKENKRFLVMKEGVIYDLNKIDMIEGLKLDFFRVDYFLTRKESKPYLCQICKLNEICQMILITNA